MKKQDKFLDLNGKNSTISVNKEKEQKTPSWVSLRSIKTFMDMVKKEIKQLFVQTWHELFASREFCAIRKSFIDDLSVCVAQSVLTLLANRLAGVAPVAPTSAASSHSFGMAASSPNEGVLLEKMTIHESEPGATQKLFDTLRAVQHVDAICDEVEIYLEENHNVLQRVCLTNMWCIEVFCCLAHVPLKKSVVQKVQHDVESVVATLCQENGYEAPKRSRRGHFLQVLSYDKNSSAKNPPQEK
jgi:hypothetical protein